MGKRDIGHPITKNMYYLMLRVHISHEDTKTYLVPVSIEGEGQEIRKELKSLSVISPMTVAYSSQRTSGINCEFYM